MIVKSIKTKVKYVVVSQCTPHFESQNGNPLVSKFHVRHLLWSLSHFGPSPRSRSNPNLWLGRVRKLDKEKISRLNVLKVHTCVYEQVRTCALHPNSGDAQMHMCAPLEVCTFTRCIPTKVHICIHSKGAQPFKTHVHVPFSHSVKIYTCAPCKGVYMHNCTLLSMNLNTKHTCKIAHPARVCRCATVKVHNHSPNSYT